MWDFAKVIVVGLVILYAADKVLSPYVFKPQKTPAQPLEVIEVPAQL